MKTTNLQQAKKQKNDEFYTQLSDIEKEVKNYKKYFKDKVVYCNCDDPEWSNFFKYFTNAFEFLGLKKVITTHYEKDGEESYKLELDSQGKVIKTPLKGDGDFRSEECIEILKEADIVITNPPFSLFREYVGQLIEYDKKFLIIGNNNAITYKDTFQFIKNNQLWQGITPRGMNFILKNGDIKSVNANWWTNLEHKKRNEKFILFKTYKENEYYYPKYDNCDAIEVSKTKEIPIDYEGVMGVPITFMDKYNPEQFLILGLDHYSLNNNEENWRGRGPDLNGKAIYRRLLIKNKNPKKL